MWNNSIYRISFYPPYIHPRLTKINKKHETFVVKKKKRHRICLDVAFLRIKYTILRKAYVIPPQNRLPSYYGIRFERLRLPLISR